MTSPDTLELRVIFGDTDQMGVVYYANYLRFFEAARAHFLRNRHGNYAQIEAQGLGLPVVEAHCRYRAPLRYEDLFTVTPKVSAIDRVTCRFDYVLARGETRIAEGWTVHACVNAKGRPVALPAEIARLLAAPVGP
jgi:acyl-CoA thioester hydrolase